MNVWLESLGLLFVTLFLAIAGIWAFQRWGIYSFDPAVTTPAESGLPGARAVRFVSEDGTAVTAWLVDPVGARPVIISFQGNGARTAASARRLLPLVERGYGLAMMQYRGMGDGLGHPSELNFAMDARALNDQLDDLFGMTIPADRRVVHGISLGTSVGARLATTRPVGAVVLESTLTSGCKYYEKRYKGFPWCSLMWAERNEVLNFVRQITTPILILHGAKDKSIPVDWALAVFEAANEPKKIVILPEAGHTDLDRYGMDAIVDEFLTASLP